MGPPHTQRTCIGHQIIQAQQELGKLREIGTEVEGLELIVQRLILDFDGIFDVQQPKGSK